jgi:hypothetical protein
MHAALHPLQWLISRPRPLGRLSLLASGTAPRLASRSHTEGVEDVANVGLHCRYLDAQSVSNLLVRSVGGYQCEDFPLA